MVATRDPEQPLATRRPWTGSETPSARRPRSTDRDDRAEPALAIRLLTRLASSDGPAALLAGEIRAASENGRPILVTGCGTSEHGALATAEVLREALWAIGLPATHGRTGTPTAIQAFEASLERELAGPAGLVIGISHEGGTCTIALERARVSGARVAPSGRIDPRGGPRRRRRATGS
jgi:fructoselysine-6-P-deglycase FrlB-like protein